MNPNNEFKKILGILILMAFVFSAIVILFML